MTRQDQLTYISPLFWGLAFITSMMWAPAYESELFGAAFALLVVSAVCADGIGIYKGYWSFPKGPVMTIGLGFWLLTLLSIIFADVPYVAYVFFFQFSLLPVAFLSFVAGHNTCKRLNIAGLGLCAATAGLSLFAITQYFALPGWLHNGTAAAYPFKNPNGLAALLALGVFAALAFTCSVHKRKHAIVTLFLAAVSGLGIYTTGGRAVFIAMAIACLVMIALLPRVVRVRNARSLSAFAGIMLAGFVLFSVLPSADKGADKAGPAAQAQKTIGASGGLLSSRPEIWRATAEMIRDNPWTGTGIGTFFLYYPEYRIQGEKSAGYMAHNEPLQFWAELGIAGPVLFYAFLVAGFVRTWKAARAGRNAHDPDKQAAYTRMIVTFCGLGVIIVHAHVSFPLHISAILLAAGWHLAQWYHAGTQLLGPNRAIVHMPANLSPRWREPLIGSLLGLGVVMILGALSPMIASEHYIHKAKRSADAGNVEAYARYVNKADRLGLGINAKAYQMAAAIPLGILESDEQISDSKAQEMFRKTDKLLDKALRHNPRLAQSYTYKARARMAMAERTGSAPAPEEESLLRRALSLNPKFLPARETLYRYYKEKGEDKRAYAVLKEGMDWHYDRYDLRGYYRVLGREALRQADPVMHAKTMKKRRKLDKKDKNNEGDTPTARNALQGGWIGLDAP